MALGRRIMASQCCLSKGAFVTYGRVKLDIDEEVGTHISGRVVLLHEGTSCLHFSLPLRNASSMAMISFSVGTKQYVPKTLHCL